MERRICGMEAQLAILKRILHEGDIMVADWGDVLQNAMADFHSEFKQHGLRLNLESTMVSV